MEKALEAPRRLGLRITAAVFALGLWTMSVFLHGKGGEIFAAFFAHAKANWGPDGRALAEKAIFSTALGLGLIVLAITSVKILATTYGRRATPELLTRWAAGLLVAWATNRYFICIQSECVHYAQYGFVAFMLSYATRNPRLGFLLAVFCGFLDESNQWWRMYFHEVDQHLDWSDMCLNTAGAMCGALPFTSAFRLRRYAEGKEDAVETGSPMPQILGILAVGGLVLFLTKCCDLGRDLAWPYFEQLDSHKPFHQFNPHEGIPGLLGLTLLGYYLVDERRKNLPMGLLLALLVAWHIGLHLPSDAGEPVHEKVPTLTVPMAKGPITIDGKLDEPDWQNPKCKVELHRFALDPDEDDMKRLPLTFGPEQKTAARLLWDDKALYVAFECETKDVWARDLPRDHAQIANHPCVEVFLDPDNAERTYYEYEVSAANQQADYFCYIPQLPQWTPFPTVVDFVNLPGWDAKNWKTAVTTQGGVCDVISASATATPRALPATQGYTVEMAIPWTDMKGRVATDVQDFDGKLVTHRKPGAKLRLNLYRVETYRSPDPAKPLPGTYMAWSETRAPLNFHRPSLFGQITLGE